MNIHRPRFPFARRHNVDRLISIQIDEYSIFWRLHMSDGNRRPRLSNSLLSRMKVDPYEPPFFPTCGDIKPGIAINISQSDPIRTSRRTVDGVSRPRLASHRHCDGKQ
jgi:hypothetical protein